MSTALTRVIALGTLIGAASAAGCGARGAPALVTHDITQGVVATDGLVIEGNGFELRAGERFRPPFQSRCWNRGQAETAELLPDVVVHGYQRAREWGAQRVRVMLPNRPLLHGLLMLCPAVRTAYGPGSRSYRVVVPDYYADGASHGRVSVVYERQYWSGGNWYGWVLWLSEDDVFQR